jgi:diaminohydroxyphosphoribosylaminopyrimidine deaminase/5-amino-6-(5-phosphoribosylamino)uracil reductase
MTARSNPLCRKQADLLPFSTDSLAMSAACAEARKWLGATSPNPPVGAAALGADGNILAVAAHKKAGEAHAEAALLEICRAQNLLPRVHTICVTLEPCNHHGRTPPCSEAIIKAGIKRVVVGACDPNPNVKGGGIERLKEAGIEVVAGVNEDECRQLIHAFAYSVQTKRPWITIKRAFDVNGSMIPPKGQKTFTSPTSLRLAHRLRKKADAILTGSGTVLADAPLFTVRHTKDFAGKKRTLAILDRRGRVPQSYLKAAHEVGFVSIIFQDISAAIEGLAQSGVRDVLVEAGPTLAQVILDSGLWAMSVTIRQTSQQGGQENDTVEAEFNPAQPMPFDTNKFRWDYFLPEE